MFGVEPYSGHSFKAQWMKYNLNTKTYEPAKDILIKGESGIGVSTGVKEQVRTQDNSGRWVIQNSFTVHTVQNYKYAPRDKIKFIDLDETYVILKTTPDITHDNSIQSLMFNGTIQVPQVLYLGTE